MVENVPAGQFVHCLEPGEDEKEPGGQLPHKRLPVKDENVPALQFAQALSRSTPPTVTPYVPKGQLKEKEGRWGMGGWERSE